MSLTIISDYNRTGKSAYLLSLEAEGYMNFWTVFNRNKILNTLNRIWGYYDQDYENESEAIEKWAKQQTLKGTKLYLDDADRKLHPALQRVFGLMLVELSKRVDIVMVTSASVLIQALQVYSTLKGVELKFYRMEDKKPRPALDRECHYLIAEPYKIINKHLYNYLIEEETND